MDEGSERSFFSVRIGRQTERSMTDGFLEQVHWSTEPTNVGPRARVPTRPVSEPAGAISESAGTISRPTWTVPARLQPWELRAGYIGPDGRSHPPSQGGHPARGAAWTAAIRTNTGLPAGAWTERTAAGAPTISFPGIVPPRSAAGKITAP